MLKTQIDTVDFRHGGYVFRLSVTLLVSSCLGSTPSRDGSIGLRLRIKRRFTFDATDTSRATATVLQAFYLCVLGVLCG
jgi:hypothetical protein